jgi:hypothetical protein
MSATEINFVVEGALDAAVARRLIRSRGGTPGMERVTRGKGTFIAVLPKYHAAARVQRWLAIRDLDHDAECAPALIQAHQLQPSDFWSFRIAVREVEAWLMADRVAFADALGVRVSAIPTQPEAIADPKLVVVNLARRSRKRDIQLGLVPEAGAGITIGPEYSAWMSNFAESTWDPDRACETAVVPSLVGALRSIQSIAGAAKS